MHTFFEYAQYVTLANRLKLLETFFPLDSGAYDSLFATELKRLAMQTPDPTARKEFEELENFKYTNYIRAAVRNSGVNDPRELDEKVHEVVSKLLLGKLFNFIPSEHRSFAARFKVSVANAVKNQAIKDQNRQRNFPSIPISHDPNHGISPDQIAARDIPGGDDSITNRFRELVGERLGPLATKLLDLRMDGGETKSLVGDVSLGNPSSYAIKQTVQKIKQLASEFARQQDDEAFLWRIERAMGNEKRTVEKRFGKRESSSLGGRV